ncbi:hypothetical protein RchiOBHm_Chr5g0010911 [Rosa chinensis]|uniref:Transmembrane protein n=1 Tax=Rosa chinensis TaxID=74649 RepID=A0A2P6Q4Q0_ROSCH|nr:hypothetical protein RchiOBHm_Chr5g0010911 [Rosa chinensis]
MQVNLDQKTEKRKNKKEKSKFQIFTYSFNVLCYCVYQLSFKVISNNLLIHQFSIFNIRCNYKLDLQVNLDQKRKNKKEKS